MSRVDVREPIIEVRQATVYRGTTRALDEISLTIRQECHTAILGPNGAGKSTFLRLITREVYPVQRPGSYVRLFGRERWNVWDLRSRLGMVSHELHNHYPQHVRGEEVILSGFYASVGTWPSQSFRPEQRERARHLMEALDILHLASRSLGEMSAGEQRRFLLARALVHNPDVLVLDEPTNGLDLPGRLYVMDAVRRLLRKGRTLLLVTHRLEEIPPEVDYIVLLKRGRVLAEGRKAEVLNDRWLSELFGLPLHVIYHNGYYQVLPEGRE